MNRANGGMDLFLDEKDYLRFLKTIERAVTRFKFKIFSYCLMPTHFHLLIQTGEIDLSRIMHWIETAYAMYFNRRHKHSGHVFQGRFKSLHCRNDAYFFELLRYINLNAVRKGLVADPADWPWCSHDALRNGVESNLLSPDFPLSLFNEDLGKARQLYARSITDAIQDCRNAADPFQAAMQEQESSQKETSHERANISTPPSLEEIAESVSAETGIDLETLRSRIKGDDAAAARRLLAARATALGHRPTHIAAAMNRSVSTVAWYLDALHNFMGPGP